MTKPEIQKKIEKCKKSLEWYKKNVKPEILEDKDNVIHIIIGEYRFQLMMYQNMLDS